MSTDEARQVLRAAGYYVNNLWHVNDVEGVEDKRIAHGILHGALSNEHVMNEIHFAIKFITESYKNKNNDNT